MTGTILNAAGVLLGALASQLWRRPLSADFQSRLKLFLGGLAAFIGVRAVWVSVHGTFTQVLKQLGVALLALILGHLLGRAMRLQKLFRCLGGFAEEQLSRPRGEQKSSGNAFVACAVVFCFNPLGVTGAIQDGLGENRFHTLALKAALDGLAAMGLVPVFGWRVPLAVLPLVAFQGALTVGARLAAPHLTGAMIDSIHAVAGLIVLSSVLLIFGTRKVQLADYLPCLAVAPLLACWCR